MIQDLRDTQIEQLKQTVRQLSKDLFLLNEKYNLLEQERDALLEALEKER